jgi:hypothetical protein
VAEALRDDLGVNAGTQRHRRVRVAQVVKSDARKPCRTNEASEPPRHGAGVERASVLAAEDERVSLGYLPMLGQQSHGELVESYDSAPPFRLGLRGLQNAAHDDD